MNNEELVFTPKQLREADEFILDKDIITVVTVEGKTYTKERIREMINKFRNKEVW